METYRGVRLEEIESISRGRTWHDGHLLGQTYFINLKDGTEKMIEYLGTREDIDAFNKEIKEVRTKIADLNNVPEQYTVNNTVYIDINGNSVPFGKQCTDRTGERLILTNKEVDMLDKQFKMSYPKFSELTYCQCFGIKNGKASGPLPQRYVDNLEYMGYDISCLDYELKEEE